MPSGTRCLVTGAAGLLGSHIAERLVERASGSGPWSAARRRDPFLEVARGRARPRRPDRPAACARAVRGVDAVYHAAAKVGDWGPWREFQAGCIDATGNLAEASASAGVGRFLHISSTSAYGHPPERGAPIDEAAPLGQDLWVWDHYTRSKVECERLLWDWPSARARRDRHPPELALRRARPDDRRPAGRAAPRGERPPDRPRATTRSAPIYAGNVADAAILAARDPGSAGEAYNVTDQGPITQAEFLNLFAEAAGAPPVARRVPYAAGLRDGLRPGGARPPDAPAAPSADHPVCHLADGPRPRLQHRQGPRPGSAGPPPSATARASNGPSAGISTAENDAPGASSPPEARRDAGSRPLRR